MAKKSVWIWVGIVAAVVFVILGMCTCAGFYYLYSVGQKSAEATKIARRAVPLIADADSTLNSVVPMDSAVPSQSKAAAKTLGPAADLSNAGEKLADAKTYLDRAADVGASGSVDTYVTAKLASTRDKLDLVELRKRQAKELSRATRAAVLVARAHPLMDSGFRTINQSVDYRNDGNYSKAAKTLQQGNVKVTRAHSLYKEARGIYKKADFSSSMAAIERAQLAIRYKKQLDSLGLSEQFSRYNKVRLNANSAWDRAWAAWQKVDGIDDTAVVDKAYNSAVKSLLARISAETTSANQNDSAAGTLDSSSGSSGSSGSSDGT